MAAKNSVAIFLERNFGTEFVHGGPDCPQWAEGEELEDKDEGDWASWGCRSG